ncbi:MAG: F0F1 ATP synthase subunit A [Planctomycetota bacterium]
MFFPSFLAAADDPLAHVLDHDFGLGPYLTMNTLTMILVAILLVVTMRKVAQAIGTGPESEGNDRYVTKGRFAQLIEVVVIYMRDTVIRPQLGHQANKFTPFLLTLFFFVLFCNLAGLVPLLDLQKLFGALFAEDYKDFLFVGGTATGRLAVTGALALIAFILWQVNGLRESGFKGWAAHFTAGAPIFVAPLMIVVEVMGTFVKPFALALRLFANMTAGHVLLAVLTGFIIKGFTTLGPLAGTPIAVVSLGASVAIMFLEIFVAFLQAFIFMFLTTLFIAQLSHHEHDDHAGAEAYDEEHPLEQDRAIPVSQV